MKKSGESTFRKIVGKVWNDPVSSNLIATLVVGAVTIVATAIPENKSNRLLLLIVPASLWLTSFYLFVAKAKPILVLDNTGSTPTKGGWRFSQRIRKAALFGIITVPAVAGISLGLQYYMDQIPENRIIILVVDFHSLDGGNYGVTDNLVEQLRIATKNYADVYIETLDETITAKQGRQVARTKGVEKKASLVLWGWNLKYQVTAHLEVIKRPAFLHLQQPAVRVSSAFAMDESFEIQTRVASDLEYLVLLTIGLTRFERRDFNGAITLLTAAVQNSAPREMIDPSIAYFVRGCAYFFKRDYSNAILDMSEVIRIDPNHVIAYVNRAGLYNLKRDRERSFADSLKAVELANVEIGSGKDGPLSYLIRGTAFLNADRCSDAIADFTEFLKKRPDDVEALQYRAACSRKVGEYEHAIVDYSHVITLDRLNSRAYIYRGSVYGMTGRNEEALADFNFALTIQPEDADALIGRGNVFQQTGKVDQAIVEYSKALKFDSNNVFAYGNRGAAYFDKGELDTAIADLSQAIERDSDYNLPYIARGRSYAQKGNYQLAIADFDEYVRLTPSDAFGYFCRGASYAATGRCDIGLKDLNKAIELKPDDSSPYFYRGNCYYVKGNFDRAIAEFDEAIKRNPNFAAAYSMKQKAYEKKNKADPR